MDAKVTSWCRAAGNVVAWLAGARATDVWSSYERFEQDSGILFDIVEDFYNTVKPVLEERARKVLAEAQDET